MKVTQIFREKGNMHNILPEYLSVWTTKQVRKEGVNVLNETNVENVKLKDGQLHLHLNNGKTVFFFY